MSLNVRAVASQGTKCGRQRAATGMEWSREAARSRMFNKLRGGPSNLALSRPMAQGPTPLCTPFHCSGWEAGEVDQVIFDRMLHTRRLLVMRLHGGLLSVGREKRLFWLRFGGVRRASRLNVLELWWIVDTLAIFSLVRPTYQASKSAWRIVSVFRRFPYKVRSYTEYQPWTGGNRV